jgi:hypothetical protein
MAKFQCEWWTDADASTTAVERGHIRTLVDLQACEPDKTAL